MVQITKVRNLVPARKLPNEIDYGCCHESHGKYVWVLPATNPQLIAPTCSVYACRFLVAGQEYQREAGEIQTYFVASPAYRIPVTKLCLLDLHMDLGGGARESMRFPDHAWIWVRLWHLDGLLEEKGRPDPMKSRPVVFSIY